MWRQVRETGREGLQEKDRRRPLKKRPWQREQILEREMERERGRGEIDTWERDGGVGERQGEEEKKSRHRGRDRDGREMEGHLRYRELGPPNSSGFQGNGDGRAPGMIPSPWNGLAHSSPPPSATDVPVTP